VAIKADVGEMLPSIRQALEEAKMKISEHGTFHGIEGGALRKLLLGNVFSFLFITEWE